MKTILSIDDEPRVLECFKDALNTRGYDIRVTSDPLEGLRILKEEDISLAMLDVKMPGMSGFEIYSEFRKVRRIPALFVTAYPKSFTVQSDDFVEMWQKEFSHGDTDVIYKPFDLSTLFEKVEGLIGEADDDSGAEE